ncbi:hypothetical protein CB1_000993024, partial [Camelus ferus]
MDLWDLARECVIKSKERDAMLEKKTEEMGYKVVDYNKLVQPRFDEALEILTRNTIAEATEAAINVVKEKLTELQAKRQVSEPAEDITVGTEIPKGSKEDLATQELFETVVLPEFPEDAYPDVPEMEPIKEKITFFTFAWKLLETTINDSSAQILHLEIADKTPEELLQKVVETMEKPFQYAGWELTMEDYDEETEDYQAEADADEELEEEEEDEEENEDRIKEKKRHLGDTKHFCPVALKENFILQPGSVEEAAKYRERIYYFSSPEAKEKFLEQPEVYVAHEEPLKAPPLRICLLGPRGSGKTVCGRQLAEKFGIFHIQFEEFLQEKLMLKTEKKIGPEYEDDSEEEQFAKQELEELAIQANVTIEEENMKKLPHEVQFTEEEEAIRLNLTENEPLPPEILEGILSEWWFKEPIRSTGFILDGFPRYPDEVEFLGEHGFFPDAAVFIQVDDRDISDRLLPTQIGKWKVKQQRKLERKKLIKEMKAKIKDMQLLDSLTFLPPVGERYADKALPRISALGLYTGSFSGTWVPSTKCRTVREDEDISEEDPEEDTDDIENILEDEFPKDEEVMSEEDEEQEIDALERLRSELREKFEADMREALRYVLSNQPDTELALMLNWHLHKGRTAPDELALQALELSLMGSTCNTAGLPYPLHNSSQIIAVKNSKYRKNIDEIRQYYQEQHQNWYVIDGFHSKWWVWNEVIKKVQMMNKHVQIYLERIKAGKAACIDKLCISPEELISRLGEFGQYCPVSLAESYELVDCSVTDSLEFAAEFRGHYYKMSSQEKLNKFLENPELYVPPLAPHPLPSAEMIPKRLTLSELKSRFPKCAELQGYCPVTYKDGKQRQVLTLVQVQNDSSTRTLDEEEEDDDDDDECKGALTQHSSHIRDLKASFSVWEGEETKLGCRCAPRVVWRQPERSTPPFQSEAEYALQYYYLIAATPKFTSHVDVVFALSIFVSQTKWLIT